jgi:predicted nucleic acid-binding protein
MEYLLDTNICIYFFKGQFGLIEKMRNIGFHNFAISEITLAELIYGAEKSQRRIDNLCLINEDFRKFIELVETLITAEDKYYNSIKKEFKGFCDNYFINDADFENYCIRKNIPVEDLET